MPYSTQADLLNQLSEQELVELTDDARTGAVDAAKVTAAIKTADATIDAYAGGRYSVPLAVSDKVKALSVDLAIYELEKRRRRIRPDSQAAYNAAIAFLKDVASGKAVLDQAGALQTSELDVKKPDREDDPRVFEDSELQNW